MRLTKSELDEILKKNKHVTVDDGYQEFKPTGKFEKPTQAKHFIVSIDNDIKIPITGEIIGKDKKFFNVTETKSWRHIGDNQKKLSFTVPGIPVPAPRQTQRDKWMKRPCVMRYREYGATLRSFINLHDMYVGKITGIFYLPMPKSWSKKKKDLMRGKPHRQRGDWDNFMKGVQDLLLKNDAMIWAGYGETRWEDERGPRTELTFETTE